MDHCRQKTENQGEPADPGSMAVKNGVCVSLHILLLFLHIFLLFLLVSFLFSVVQNTFKKYFNFKLQLHFQIVFQTLFTITLEK